MRMKHSTRNDLRAIWRILAGDRTSRGGNRTCRRAAYQNGAPARCVYRPSGAAKSRERRAEARAAVRSLYQRGFVWNGHGWTEFRDDGSVLGSHNLPFGWHQWPGLAANAR